MATMAVLGWSDKDCIPSSGHGDTTTTSAQELLDSVADKVMKDFVLISCKTSEKLLSQIPPKSKGPSAEILRTECEYHGCQKHLHMMVFYDFDTVSPWAR